jgi:hypothetical protein
LVIPPQPVWYVLDKGNLASWGWSSTRPCTTTNGQTCRLYPPDPAAHAAALAAVERITKSQAWQSFDLSPQIDPLPARLDLPVNLGNQIQFLGHQMQNRATEADPISLLTAWRVTAPPDGTRAIFAHLLAPDGKVVSQWDGLDVPVEGWRTGDTLIQQVSLSMPGDVAPGTYWIQVGMYNPETMKRLPVLDHGQVVAERILLIDLRLK